jgi:hypothetical protein
VSSNILFTLVHGHRALIIGLNSFLTQGYCIECGPLDTLESAELNTPEGNVSLLIPDQGSPLATASPSDDTKGMYLVAPETFMLQSTPLPPPRVKEAQVAIRSTTLCESDIAGYKHFRDSLPVQEPLVPGRRAAGVVVAVSAEVKRSDVSVGDHVAIECRLEQSPSRWHVEDM